MACWNQHRGLGRQGDTLAVHPVVGTTTMYNNETLDYFGVPFEVVDRYELSRYITPYGINLTLDSDGWAWVFDVTDYAPCFGTAWSWSAATGRSSWT